MKSVFDKAHRVFCDCMNDGTSVIASMEYLRLASFEADNEKQRKKIIDMRNKLSKEYFSTHEY